MTWRSWLVIAHRRLAVTAGLWFALLALAPLAIAVFGEDGTRRPCAGCPVIPPPSFDQIAGVGAGAASKLLVVALLGWAVLLASLVRAVDLEVPLSIGIAHPDHRFGAWSRAILVPSLVGITALVVLQLASTEGQLVSASSLGSSFDSSVYAQAWRDGVRLLPGALLVGIVLITSTVVLSWVFQSVVVATIATSALLVAWDRIAVARETRTSLAPGVSLLTAPRLGLGVQAIVIASGLVVVSLPLARLRRSIR